MKEGGLLCALAAPELTLLQALRQSHNCKIGMNIMKDPSFERWTNSHSSLVRMKGLRKNRAKSLTMITHFTNGFYTAAKTQRDLSSTLEKSLRTLFTEINPMLSLRPLQLCK